MPGMMRAKEKVFRLDQVNCLSFLIISSKPLNYRAIFLFKFMIPYLFQLDEDIWSTKYLAAIQIGVNHHLVPLFLTFSLARNSADKGRKREIGLTFRARLKP
jgi:hypothetical protein